MRIHRVIFFCFVAIAAYGDPRCDFSLLSGLSRNPEPEFEPYESEVSPDEAKEMEEVVRRLFRIATAKLWVPRPMGVQFLSQSPSPQYHSSVNYLTSPYRILFGAEGEMSTPEQARSALAHEVGHAVANSNFGEFSRDYLVFRGSDFFSSQILAAKTPEERQMLKALSEEFEREAEQRTEELAKLTGRDPYEIFETHMMLWEAYHELMADIVAVIHDRDPSAIRNALWAPGYSEKLSDEDREAYLKRLSYRDLGTPIEVKGNSFSPTDQYDYFAIVRGEVGTYLKTLYDSEAGQTEAMLRTLQAVGNSATEQFRVPELLFSNENVVGPNKRVLQHIDSAFTGNEVPPYVEAPKKRSFSLAPATGIGENKKFSIQEAREKVKDKLVQDPLGNRFQVDR